MYKPGNASTPPPLVTPHQPRLDWQMWFAALGPHTQAPWFTSLVYRLLQGHSDGMCVYAPDSAPPQCWTPVRTVDQISRTVTSGG